MFSSKMNSKQTMNYLPSFFDITFLLYVVFVTTTSSVLASSYNGNETDHLALLSFKKLITQDPYGHLDSWNTSFHFCDWHGVSCGKRHRRVTVVRLISEGLEGSLTPHLGNLSFLRKFLLMNNSFQGSIPHELGRLSRLHQLGLKQNKFSGSIPANLSGCSNLKVLALANNKLVGSIPKELSFLSKLQFVDVSDNNLTGGIPPFLGNITSMVNFSITTNPMGGNIPDTLGNWKNLTHFQAGDCKLYGTIPHSIYNLSLLSTLYLAMNKLAGTIPSDIGAMLPHIEFLQLFDNQLTGFLPPSISNCSKLRFLEIGYNGFEGRLTIDFGKLENISLIALGNTNLYAHEMKFIDSLKNCSRLRTLYLFNGKFEGVLPSSIGNLSDQLENLDVGGNKLYGNMPSSIGNLVGLTTLALNENHFTGSIPSIIGKLKNLLLLSLFQNQFSGKIPDATGNLSMLDTLYLDSNLLEGNIPSSLGNCRRLSQLFLYDNKLSGEIPKQLLQLSSLSIVLTLSQNNLSGSLPLEVGDLKMLSNLDISDNSLSGNIPDSLGACTSLTILSLKGNLFQGIIPPSISSLRGLESLDLSHNNLSGQIPLFLELFSLQLLNLSFNNFGGEVPVKGVFANASAFSILGNSRLCGGLAELGLPKCKVTKKRNKKFPMFVIVILITSTLFVVLCFVYAWFKKNRKEQPCQSSTNERFLKVSYSQLLKATGGFSEANLIGKGGFSSVYKGNLDHDDNSVAIKVLHLQNRGADRSFMAECEIWRSIRHRNLLKIITSCSSVDFQGNDFKALVYEFMPNGSLHDWLHSSTDTSRLNIHQRINILIDVASALDYLHNQCLPSVVHGDLKPSNILLDDDMVAHVGDFGLARFLKADSYQNSSTGIKGTIGYVPPEYGLGSEITSSGDVYSFGILLLEVMTGKRPTDDIFNEGLNLHKFAYMISPDNVTDIIDGELMKFDHEDEIAMKSRVAKAKKIEECLVLTVNIGVSCSMESPPDRMNIKTVVHELQHISDTIQNI